MTGIQTTIYIRSDEMAKIEEFMATSHLKRHQVLKLALRRFLFPTETRSPLNGAVAEVKIAEDTEKRRDTPPRKTEEQRRLTHEATYGKEPPPPRKHRLALEPHEETEFNEEKVIANLGLKETQERPFLKKEKKPVKVVY